MTGGSAPAAAIELTYATAAEAPKIAQVYEYRAIAENPYYLSGRGGSGDQFPWTVMFKWVDAFGYVREAPVQTFATLAIAAQVMRGLSDHRRAVFQPKPIEALEHLSARDVGRDTLTGDTLPNGAAARRTYFKRMADRKPKK
jgi:hypothetical protein